MSRIRRASAAAPLLASSLALTLLSTSLPAQYRRAPSDTIRLREVTSSAMAVTAPGTSVEVQGEHEAVIAVTFGPADSARAWYESLRVVAITPQGRLSPSTDAALRRPFLLHFDARGRITTLDVPPFPASFEGVTDLSHQFDDFFLRLPAEPLALGLAWLDTAVVETRGSGGARWHATRLASHRVLRDTVVGGEEAWVIASVQRHTMRSTQPIKGQPVTLHTELAGTDSGSFVFSKQGGRMLGRERSGSLSGSMSYEGGPQPLSLPVRQRYRNRVTSIP